MKRKLLIYTYFSFYEQKNERMLNLHSLYGYNQLINQYEITNIVYQSRWFGIPNIYRVLLVLLSDKQCVFYVPQDIRIFWIHILRHLNFIKNPIIFIVHNSLRTCSHYSIWRKLYYSILRWVMLKSYSTLYVLGEGVQHDNVEFFRNFKVINLAWGMDVPNLTKCSDKYDVFFTGSNKRDIGMIYEMLYISEWTLLSTTHLIGVQSDRIKTLEIPNTGMHQEQLLNAMNCCSCVLIPVDNEYDQVVGASVLVEALALGKTIVAPRKGAKLFDIEYHGIGCYYELGDVNSFIKAVEKALRLFETEEFLVNANLLREQYNNMKFTEKILSIIHD